MINNTVIHNNKTLKTNLIRNYKESGKKKINDKS